MINSLFKDSHITQPLRHSNFYNLQSREKRREKSNENIREYCSVAQEKSNQGIIVKKPTEINFSGFSNAKATEKVAHNVPKIYTSKAVKKFLEMAADSQAVFDATYAIGLTCFLRPASIVVMPSDKKNKDDNKYAAAHSIASGVIAYLISVVVSKPIADSLKKIAKNKDTFIKTPSTQYLKEEKAFTAAKNYVNLIPNALISPLRATITIALIPVILKYIFGLEKKKSENSKNIGTSLDDYALINFKSTGAQKAKSLQNFMGGTK